MNSNYDVTPIGVTRKGRLVYGDQNGEREFSPRTMRAIQLGSAALLLIVGLAVVLTALGIIPPAPWSPMGQA